jgi:hypothetical protein
MKTKKMNKYLILILITLWAFTTKAQSNYFLANSEAGVEISETASSTLTGQNHKDTSKAVTVQTLWFVSPRGYDGGTGNYIQGGKLNAQLKNLSATFKKVSLYDFTGTNLIRTVNLAPNAETCFCFPAYTGDQDRRLDASKNYYWKFETVATQTPTFTQDNINIPASNFAYVDVLANDLNLPAGSDCRLKSGQSLTNITVTKDQYTGLKVVTGSAQGAFTFVYEVIDASGTLLGQGSVLVTVGSASQYCTLAILDDKLQTGSQTVHEFTLYSPNASINPFNYEVTNVTTGLVVKTGTTPTATSNKELINFGTLSTGTYNVKFSSTTFTCFDNRQVSHVEPSQSCDVSIISVDKVNGTNNYTVNTSFSGVASIKTLVTSATNVNQVAYQATGVTAQTFTINLATSATGTYFVSLEGEGKYCTAQKSFDHTFVSVGLGANKLETYTKFIHNYKDKVVISGKVDNESGRDKFGQLSYDENKTNLEWKSFISDFENAGNSPLAKALIGLRLDTARNARHISIAVMPNQLVLQTRATKSGSTDIVATVSGITAPVWVRLVKTGNDIKGEYSKDLTMSPNWTTIGTVVNSGVGYGKYQRFLGVTSAKSDVTANATFRGYLGGAVDFTPTSITINPPMITSNVLTPTSGQGVTLSSTGCVGGAENKWFKGSTSTSFASGNSVNVSAYNTDSYYALCQNGLNSSIKSNVIAFDITGTLVSCKNGNSFDIVSTVYGSSQVTFIFNASNLITGNYSVLSGSTSVKTGTFMPITQTVTVSTGLLNAGNYIFKIDGVSCSGTAQKSFAVTGGTGSVTPTVTSNISAPINGNTIILTATGCVGNYNWYKNAEVNPFASTAGTTTITNATGGSYYFATCLGSSSPSNYIQVSIVAGNGILATDFTNNTNLVAFETALGKYNPGSFPTISVVNSTDAIINKTFPNWSISWKVDGANFTNATKNKKTPNLGIPFMFDMAPAPYGGYGQRCIDYIYPQDPNTGSNWDSDNACADSQFNLYYNNLAHTNANFSSALPFEQRAGDGGGAGLDRITEWNGISDLSYFYDQGTIGVERFGLRDWVNGKANVGLSDYDNEATIDSDKSLALLLGMSSRSQGYVFDQYANILQAVYIDPSQYPNDFNNANSTYPQYSQLIDGSNGEPNNGGSALVTNNVPTRAFWNPAYKIAIPSKFSGTKGVSDALNVMPSTEISCLSSATFRQGETYIYNNNGSTRVVNKFGLNANTQHMIARTIFAGETHKWYCVNKLNNRKMILQAKILCDQQQNGLLLDQAYANTYITNTALANKHFDREYSFDIGAFVAFTGCEWNIWDRNQQGVNLDGYHGAFGIINLLNQRKVFGNESVSFVDLKPRANFLLWTSQISYDGGTTYLQEKSNKYVMTSTSIPQRQFITPDGYWGGFLARPENTEATSCVLKVVQNGQTYTHTVTPSMWETVDYDYRNTSLASLPNDKKDYHYFLIKLGSQVSDGVGVTAPTINSSPSNPTAGTSVTFTATGCTGTLNWFVGDASVSSQNPYTVVNPAVNDTYFATCTNNGVTSAASSSITIGISIVSSAVTITEPNKPQYYFSDSHDPSWYDGLAHNPIIFTNTPRYDSTADFVWLKNNKIKIGINLKRGGQLAWASRAGSSENLVYNGYDGGFQVTMDAYQKPDGYTQNGKTSLAGSYIGAPTTSYNTTMGGDYYNHSQSLIDYHPVTNGYYIKIRPIFYTMDSELSRTYIEVTYTLDGSSVKCDYKYTTYRDDNQASTGTGGFDGGHAPVCFLVNSLKKYQSYTGGSPWNINSAPEDGNLPNETAGQSDTGIPLTKQGTERWALVYRPADSKTVAIYANSTASNETLQIKRKEVYDANGSSGDEFGGGYAVLARSFDLGSSFGAYFDRSNYSKSLSSYIIVEDSPLKARQEIYRISGH